VLTAQNAVINTASVQIKTLTVAGKQVTLAVFRQLIEEHIFDWAIGGLRGVGWGHVRYLIDRPPEAAVNLVWQSGDQLRRCIVERRVDRTGDVTPPPSLTTQSSSKPRESRGLFGFAAAGGAIFAANGMVANPCRHKGERSRHSCANRRYGADFNCKANRCSVPVRCKLEQR
jgi:hypothetical protein